MTNYVRQRLFLLLLILLLGCCCLIHIYQVEKNGKKKTLGCFFLPCWSCILVCLFIYLFTFICLSPLSFLRLVRLSAYIYISACTLVYLFTILSAVFFRLTGMMYYFHKVLHYFSKLCVDLLLSFVIFLYKIFLNFFFFIRFSYLCINA